MQVINQVKSNDITASVELLLTFSSAGIWDDRIYCTRSFPSTHMFHLHSPSTWSGSCILYCGLSRKYFSCLTASVSTEPRLFSCTRVSCVVTVQMNDIWDIWGLTLQTQPTTSLLLMVCHIHHVLHFSSLVSACSWLPKLLQLSSLLICLLFLTFLSRRSLLFLLRNASSRREHVLNRKEATVNRHTQQLIHSKHYSLIASIFTCCVTCPLRSLSWI